MKKLFKIIGSIILIIIAVVVFLYFVSTPLPKKDNKEQKPKLTDKIQAAINQTAWDSTAAVSFSFRNHHYLWDKNAT
jgi:uncharacterized protein YpmB